jgi:hypothetical protein
LLSQPQDIERRPGPLVTVVRTQAKLEQAADNVRSDGPASRMQSRLPAEIDIWQQVYAFTYQHFEDL